MVDGFFVEIGREVEATLFTLQAIVPWHLLVYVNIERRCPVAKLIPVR